MLVPVVKTVRLIPPLGRGAFLWSRPAGVQIEERGETLFLPVPDWTRRIQWTLLAAGVAVFLLFRFLRGR